jgi:hypothetical protein
LQNQVAKPIPSRSIIGFSVVANTVSPPCDQVQGPAQMTPTAIGCIAFVCVFGGALLGVFFRTVLPQEHLSTDTKDVVKLGIALVATMAALVLGLLIASAKSTYDTRRTQLLQVSADIILLDRILANYGSETKTARVMLQRSVDVALEQFWPSDHAAPATVDRRSSSIEALYNQYSTPPAAKLGSALTTEPSRGDGSRFGSHASAAVRAVG